MYALQAEQSMIWKMKPGYKNKALEFIRSGTTRPQHHAFIHRTMLHRQQRKEHDVVETNNNTQEVINK